MKRKNLYQLLIVFIIAFSSKAIGQIIYQHNFNSGIVVGSNSYTTAPIVIDASLNSSVWNTAPTTFTSLAGASGAALSLSNSGGTPTYTLSFNIAPGYTCNITDYSFWRQRSNTGAQTWTLSVNGSTLIGAGSTPTTGVNTGTLAVSNPANNLSGTVNVVLQISGASGTGSFRLDDFTLYGIVSPTTVCSPPLTQATAFNTSSTGTNSVTINWTAGSGGNAIVLAKQASAVNASPSSGSVYTANSIFGSGSQIGVGNYVVYAGIGNSVTVTGLSSGTDYYFSVFEYNTTSGTPCYLTPGLTGSVTTVGVPTTTNCLQIKSILVAACGAPESYNEMVYFKNGPNPLPVNMLSIAGAPASGVYALNKWPNNSNSWFGIVQNTLTAANVNTINGSITNCGYVKEPPLTGTVGVIPANANVILVGHQTMNPTANSFANLTDTVYMIFQAAATSTAGNFTNSGAGTRGFVLIDNLNACTSNSVTYTPTLLATGGGNGDGVSFDNFNNITYYNSGCQAPFIPLSVDAGPNQTICYNATAALSGTANGTYNSVLWSGGAGTFSTSSSLTTTYTPGVSETGTVKLYCSITRSCATSSSTAKDSVYITITSLPLYSFNASNGYSLCPSATSVISYSVSNVANAGSLTPNWTSPAGTGTSYTVSAPGGTTVVTYTLNLSNSCGSTEKTFTVYPLTLPTLTLSSASSTACPNSTISLTASGNTGNYSWTNPVSTNSNVVLSSSITTTGAVTSTNSCGSVSKTYTLTIIPTATISVDNANVNLCTGQSATVTATSNAATYTWQPGGVTTNTISLNTTGVYTVSSSNVCNTASTTVNVTMSSSPSLTISSTSNTLCASGQTATLSLSGSTGTYSWSTGTSSPSISISAPGVYAATVTTSGCGTAIDSYTVNGVLTPILSVSPTATLLCNGALATLVASSNLANYVWSTTATNVNTISVNSAGTYTVGVSNACGSPTTAVIVTTNNTPVLNLTASSLSICPNEIATLTVTGGSSPYTWSNSTVTTPVSTTTGGTVIVSSTNNCGTGMASIVISVNPVNASIAATPVSGTKPLIVNFTNNSTGANLFAWNFGNGNIANTQIVSSQTYTNSGSYWVYLTVSNSVCSDIDSLLITVDEDEPWIIIPNVFTPNGDSANDVFKVTGFFNIKDFNCTIFDRWGLSMYSWSDITKGWDGKTNGKDASDGNYFYLINAKDIDGIEIKKQGTFLLIR